MNLYPLPIKGYSDRLGKCATYFISRLLYNLYLIVRIEIKKSKNSTDSITILIRTKGIRSNLTLFCLPRATLLNDWTC